MNQIATSAQIKKNDLYYAGFGALLGAGVGAFIGILAANPNVRKRVFSSYTDLKLKGIELYKDLEKIQEARNKRDKVRLLQSRNE